MGVRVASRPATAIRTWAAAVIACTLVPLVGCSAATPSLPEPAGTPTTTTLRDGDRTALLYLPAKPLGDSPALVVALHGYTGDAAGAPDFLGLRPLADLRGFLVVAPQGTTDRQGHTFWNASRACCNFNRSTVDDSAYLSRLVATVTSAYHIAPSRVYLVGHSNGGFMAYRFACDHADQIAAIASVAGALDTDGDCRPARPVSVLQVHGTADDTVHFDGGLINGQSYTSAADTIARWRRIDGCPSVSRSGPRWDADADVEGDDLTPSTWAGCREDTAVALWTISKGNHVPTLTTAFAAALYDWFEANGRR